MDKRSFSISREVIGNDVLIFEYDKVDGYKINPKVQDKERGDEEAFADIGTTAYVTRLGGGAISRAV